MDIILGADSLSRAEHARAVVEKIRSQEADPKFPRQAIPIGIAHHLARFPLSCNECGLTYWSRDEYGSHIGCSGSPPGDEKRMGF